MAQAWAKTMAMANYLESNSNYGLKDNVCLLGAVLTKRKSVRFSTYLVSGQDYVFFAGGDEDATDLDIKVYSSSGVLLKKDNKTDNNPVVGFTPNRSGNYSIELIYYSGTAMKSFACLALMKKGGNGVPVSNIVKSGKRFFSIGDLINDRASMKFHDYENQWCLFTTILDEGDSSTITNMDLGSENHVFFGVGDQNIEDADLFLFYNSDRNESNVLAQDVKRDATPIMTSPTRSSSNYKLKIKNHASRGKSLQITGVCTL